MSAQSFEPFRIDIPQTEVDDLKERLMRTRWANELPPSELERLPTRGPVQPGYQLGVPLSYVKPLVKRWREEYDWRVWEAKLNEQPQFVTNIDGQNIHFYHVRSERDDAFPLMLLHGWPNTSFEYFHLIGTSPIPRPTARTPLMPFTWSFRPSPDSGSPGTRPRSGGTPEGLPWRTRSS
jgi:epoxide hydrolase